MNVKVVANNKGFSLIELMVVVGIIGILATVAVPQVSKFMAKAKQSEAKANLSTLYSSEKAFAVEYNTFHNSFGLVGFAPEGNLNYNVGFFTASAAGGNGTAIALLATPPGLTAPAAPTVSNPGTAVQTFTYCGVAGAPCVNGNGVTTTVALGATGGAIAANTFTAVAVGKISTSSAINDVYTINQAKTITNTVQGL